MPIELSAFSGIAAIICYALVVRTIRQRHQAMWDSFGQPGFLYDPTKASSHFVAAFIRKGEWLKTNDFQLKLLGVLCYLYTVATIIFFIIELV